MTTEAGGKKYVKLLPGEDVLFREDSCVLAGAFNAEATGVVFLSNFRLLFSGAFTQVSGIHSEARYVCLNQRVYAYHLLLSMC